MRKLKLIYGVAVGVLSALLMHVAGCKKDNSAPVLELLTPITAQDISTADSVLISGRLSDNVDLHELDIIATNFTGDTVFYASPYVHGAKQETFQVYFTPPDTGAYLITVTIYDHELAATTKSVLVYAHNAASLNVTQPANTTPGGFVVEGITVFQNDSLRVSGTAADNKGLLYVYIMGINIRTGDTTATTKSVLFNNATAASFDTYLPQPDTGIFNLNIDVVNHYSFVTRKSIRYEVR